MELQNDSYLDVQKLNAYNIDYKGLNLVALSQVYIFELSLNRLDGSGILNRLKKFSIDSYVKSILSIRFVKSKKLNNAIEHVFVNDIYNKSMISNIRAVENIFEKEFIEVVNDKRVFGKDSVYIYNYFNSFSYLKQFIYIIRLLVKNFNTIKNIAQEFNIKKRFLILNIIESLFIINCIEGFFKAHKSIKKMLLNSDVHKTSRTFTLIARKYAIKTHVIQHGSTILEYGYLPVSADCFFAWGELSRDWFQKRNTKLEKLVITGTPKTDFINDYDMNESNIHKVKNILVIMNPIGEENVKEFLKIIKSAKLQIKYNLNIKLHPGSVDNIELVELFFDVNDVKIFKEKNTHDLIFKNDVVLTTTSTVGNEAIAFYKPLIKIDIKGINSKLEYETFNCCHSINSSKLLIELLRNTNKLHSKIPNYKTFLEKYFYRLDGNSAQRIKNHLL